MRSQKLFLTVGVTLLVGLFLMIAGCGEDEKSSEPVDFNDPEFVAVRGEFDQFVDSTLKFFTNGIGNLAGLATDTVIDPVLYTPIPIDSVTDSLSATYADGWHVVYIGLNRPEFVSVLRDSIQFRLDGIPQQQPGDIDELVFKHYWGYTVTDTTVSHTNFVGNSGFTFADLDLDQATIDGTHAMEASTKSVFADSTVWREFDFDATLSNFTIVRSPVGWSNTCPTAGQLDANLSMVYQRDTETPDTTVWTLAATFNDGTVWISASNGSQTWNYGGRVCSPSAGY